MRRGLRQSIIGFVPLAALVSFFALIRSNRELISRATAPKLTASIYDSSEETSRNQCRSKCVNGNCIRDWCVCQVGYEGSHCDELSATAKLPPKTISQETCPGLSCYDHPRWGRVAVSQQMWQDKVIKPDGGEVNFWRNTAVPQLNLAQQKAFARFESLPPLGKVLEFGAGPYTKTRLILETLIEDNRTDLAETVEHVYLEDPLFATYMREAKMCTYYNGTFTFGARGRVFEYPMSITAATGENLGYVLPPASFDTIILMNVIEHCHSLPAIMDGVLRLLRPGGTFLFMDRAAARGEERPPQGNYMHPLMPRSEFYDTYFQRYFDIENALVSQLVGEVKVVQHVYAVKKKSESELRHLPPVMLL